MRRWDWRKARSACLLAVAAFASWPAAAQPVPEAPDYSLAPCCDLCPLAADPALYESPDMEDYAVLVQGQGDWLFTTAELMQGHNVSALALTDLGRLQQALAWRGVQLVLVYPPPRALVHESRLNPDQRATHDLAGMRFRYTGSLELLRQEGVLVPRVEAFLEQSSDTADFYFRRDHHWTPHGARQIAAATAELIRSQADFAKLESHQVRTRPAGFLRKSGMLQRLAERICGPGYPQQAVQEYRTVIPEAADAGVVLVGGSFGRAQYNFTGFLAEQLGTAVANRSLSSGNAVDAMMKYLASEEFRARPPRFLVWQIEQADQLHGQKFFRQIVPLVADGCRDLPVALQSTQQLEPGRNEILFNGGGEVRELRGGDYQIDIAFSEPWRGPFQLVVFYLTGQDSKESFDGILNVAGQARFTIELRNDRDLPDQSFLSADLVLPEGLPPTLVAESRLCKRQNPQTQSNLAGALE